jgi:hypothetical protein
MGERFTILALRRKKLLWRLALLTLVSYSAFTNRATIKRGWQDGMSYSYQSPGAAPSPK